MKNFWKKFLIWNIIIDTAFILGAWFQNLCTSYAAYALHIVGNEDEDRRLYQGVINKGERYAKMFHLL